MGRSISMRPSETSVAISQHVTADTRTRIDRSCILFGMRPFDRVCVLFWTVVAGFACGSPPVGADSGDSSPPVDAIAADGGGVCCPLTASAGCSPQGYYGGWAMNASDCRSQSSFDGCPFTSGTDSHGCAVLVDHGLSCADPCGRVPIDAGPDGSVDASADTGGDTGGTMAGGPPSLYGGTVSGARMPSWNPDAPFPVVAMATRSSDRASFVSMLEIASDGALGLVVADRLYVWGWRPGTPGAPNVLYDGAVAGQRIPGWDPMTARPLVVMAYQTASRRWVASMLQIARDGTIGFIVADRVIVYGWAAGAAGTPRSRYDGALVGARLTPWNPDVAAPLVVMVTQRAALTRFVSMLEIRADGTFGPLVADDVSVWGF